MLSILVGKWQPYILLLFQNSSLQFAVQLKISDFFVGIFSFLQKLLSEFMLTIYLLEFEKKKHLWNRVFDFDEIPRF